MIRGPSTVWWMVVHPNFYMPNPTKIRILSYPHPISCRRASEVCWSSPDMVATSLPACEKSRCRSEGFCPIFGTLDSGHRGFGVPSLDFWGWESYATHPYWIQWSISELEFCSVFPACKRLMSTCPLLGKLLQPNSNCTDTGLWLHQQSSWSEMGRIQVDSDKSAEQNPWARHPEPTKKR